MGFLSNDIMKVVYQSALAFIVLFIISKILGKKQISQLSFIDYVIGISIGSIAAEMATDSSRPYYHFIVSMIAFGLLDFFITIISRKTRVLKNIFKGKPIILINKGQIDYKMLKKSKLDLNDLMSQCRTKGFFFVSDIEYCVFETSGDLSILPVDKSRPVVSKDFDLPVKKVELQKEFILDGIVIDEELTALNKTEEWLFKQLNIKNKKDLKNILLAVYEDDMKNLTVHYKDDVKND